MSESHFFPEERHVKHHTDDGEDQSIDGHIGLLFQIYMAVDIQIK